MLWRRKSWTMQLIKKDYIFSDSSYDTSEQLDPSYANYLMREHDIEAKLHTMFVNFETMKL